jgi:hypothetical protein
LDADMGAKISSNPYLQIEDNGSLAIRVHHSRLDDLAKYPLSDVLDDFGRNYGNEALVALRDAVAAAITRAKQGT